MRARLFCRTGELAGVDHEIEDQATIGRSPENSLQLGAAVVSQSHARIFFDRSVGAFVLEDLQSKNGTRLDGLPVEGARRLGSVHVVTFGEEHDLIFVAAPPDVGPTRQPAGDAATIRHPTSHTMPNLPSHMPELSSSAPDVCGKQTAKERLFALEMPSFDGATDDDGVRGGTSGETVSERPTSFAMPPLEVPGSAPVRQSETTGARVTLEVTDASGATSRVTLGAGRHLIGRAAECAISIDDRTLTRRHAAVTVTQDTVLLEDQDSRNGTFKSGERLTGPVSLQIGDVVTFGDQVTATVVAS